MNRLRAWWASLVALGRTPTAPVAPVHLMGASQIGGKGHAITTTAVTVALTPTLVLAYNGDRRVAVFVNTHATVAVSLGGSGIVSGQGIVLAAGASFVDTDGIAQWYAIAASGTVSVAVTEIV